MPVSIVFGANVNYVIDGHSTTNGAAIPLGSTITLSSTNAAVAAPPTIPALTADQKEVVVPVTVLAVGTCDWSGTVATPAGASFTIAADTLTVTAAVSALDHVTGTFTAV